MFGVDVIFICFCSKVYVENNNRFTNHTVVIHNNIQIELCRKEFKWLRPMLSKKCSLFTLKGINNCPEKADPLPT